MRKIECDYETEESYVYSLNDRKKIEKEVAAMPSPRLRPQIQPCGTHNHMFRDAFNKVQQTGFNRDFGTSKAAKMYFSLSDPEPNAFATGETHAPAFK